VNIPCISLCGYEREREEKKERLIMGIVTLGFTPIHEEGIAIWSIN
jgi:hypothetical protein